MGVELQSASDDKKQNRLCQIPVHRNMDAVGLLLEYAGFAHGDAVWHQQACLCVQTIHGGRGAGGGPRVVSMNIVVLSLDFCSGGYCFLRIGINKRGLSIAAELNNIFSMWHPMIYGVGRDAVCPPLALFR